MKIKRSLRDALLLALDGCADSVRDRTWEKQGPRHAHSETVRGYDRHRAATELLTAFARSGRVSKRRVATLGESLAASLPESMEDLDGTDVLEWLEQELPITWVEDRLSLPEALRPELVAIVRDALGGAVDGEMTPERRSAIARRVFERVLPGSRPASARRYEGAFADLFIQLAWGARREPELRANRAVAWLEAELGIRWLAPPRGERPYSASEAYEIGDVVIHPRFGRGTVEARTDTSIEIAFPGCMRKLAAFRRG